MYVLPYIRIVDSLVSYSLKWSGKSFMYVLPYLRIDSCLFFKMEWKKFHVCSSLHKNCR